jgi:hypothetical protein
MRTSNPFLQTIAILVLVAIIKQPWRDETFSYFKFGVLMLGTGLIGYFCILGIRLIREKWHARRLPPDQ